MEGVAQKEQLTFSYEKFAAGFTKARLDMLFPDRGVTLPYSSSAFLCNTISQWEADFPECCEGYFNDYIAAVVEHCGTWDKRMMLPHEHLIPAAPRMVAGVLQLDRKYLQAAFKRLYGRWIEDSTIITFEQLHTVAFALWNPLFQEFRGTDDNWEGYVKGLNRQHKLKVEREQRREAQLADLLTEFEGQ